MDFKVLVSTISSGHSEVEGTALAIISADLIAIEAFRINVTFIKDVTPDGEDVVFTVGESILGISIH